MEAPEPAFGVLEIEPGAILVVIAPPLKPKEYFAFQKAVKRTWKALAGRVEVYPHGTTFRVLSGPHVAIAGRVKVGGFDEAETG